MFLGEPQKSQADLNFRIAGIPIRVTPWFWIAALLLGWNVTDSGNSHLVLAWILAVFSSILIHELGHAFAFRYFGIEASVVLYHFGGLASPTTNYGYTRTSRGTPLNQLAISAAGPIAQLLAAAIGIVAIRAAGYGVFLGGFVGNWLNLPPEPMLTPRALDHFVTFFLYASIYWALLNLLPVYPLDGGQIARELFLLSGNDNAIRNSLLLSVFAAGVMVVYGLQTKDLYFALLFGMLGYSSYTAVQPYFGRDSYRGW